MKQDIPKSEFYVLDQGFIRVVDIMGDDSSIVQASRISYGAETTKISQDRGLISYLMRHRYTTPFEMCEIKLHLKVPVDTWRQWIRNKTANVNEYNTRFSKFIDDKQITGANQWRSQSKTNKQGISELLAISTDKVKLHKHLQSAYNTRLIIVIAREQARKDLSLSIYTEFYWKIDLHNLFHFLSLRMDSRAQSKICQYANVIGNEIVAKWCPIAWEAFVDYKLNGDVPKQT